MPWLLIYRFFKELHYYKQKYKNPTTHVNALHEHPGWLEISVDVDPAAHEALSAFLFNIGCEGVVSEDFNDYTLKTYLLFQNNIEDIRNRIEIFLQDLGDIFPEARHSELKIRAIKDQDWGIRWRQFFHADQVTQKLMVIPEWEPIPASLESHVIKIDPGPAFGTGQHPTTIMCLLSMEKQCFKGPWTMLDIGTGSGILAMYGVKLGAKRVAAIDIDPEAIRWARRNIELNGLLSEIEISSKPLADCEEQFSLVTANLILGTILDLSSHFPRILAPKGRLILSGILKEQVKKAEERLFKYGLYIEDMNFKEGWACLIIRQ
jgi:ribosomal protein L11 methyltransferase